MTDEVNLDELQNMQKNLSFNLGNADFLQKLGEIYYNICSLSCTNFSFHEGINISRIIDWQAHHSSIKYSLESFKLRPTIDSALLIMNSLNMVRNYSATIDFIIKQNLLERLPNEKLTVMSVLLYSIAKSGRIWYSNKVLFEFLPEYFKKAQQNLEGTEETTERIFHRLLRADNTSSFSKGHNEDDFLSFSEELVGNFQRERFLKDNIANNIKWEYSYFFSAAIDLHKEGFIQAAIQMYAVAFTLNQSESLAEVSSLASLHQMGEHQVSFERLNHYIDKITQEPYAYIIAGHSCATINNISGLELILTKSNKNNVIKNPFIDLLIGFYLESKGQTKQAVSYYQKNANNSDNEAITNIFSFRLERIMHESNLA